MRGEIIGVWPHSWSEVWSRLAEHKEAPPDLFNELYRTLDRKRARGSVGPERLGEITSARDGSTARNAFRDEVKVDIIREREAIAFFEEAFDTIEQFGEPELSNRYFALVSEFLETYSLRYDLRRPFSLCPTLPGLFASLLRDLQQRTQQDSDLAPLMRDFQDSLRDLRANRSENNLKTCIAKQVNLLEGLGKKLPAVTESTLGRICNQAATWPHEALKESTKSLYRFASDYPGIRHAGTPGNSLRVLDMRDLVAVTVLMAGFAPYLTDGFDGHRIYEVA